MFIQRTKQSWSPRGRPWSRRYILKSLALASKPQVLENCPVLGLRTALFFVREILLENTRNLAENWRTSFCFPYLEHRRSQGGAGGLAPPPIEISSKTPIVSTVSVYF